MTDNHILFKENQAEKTVWFFKAYIKKICPGFYNKYWWYMVL